MRIGQGSRVSAAVVLAGILLATSITSAEAVRRKVIRGTAIGAVVGGVVGLVVGGPRAGVAGAAVGGVAGAIVSSTDGCHWHVNSRGKRYRTCD